MSIKYKYINQPLHSPVANELAEWMDDLKLVDRRKSSKLYKMINKYEKLYRLCTLWVWKPSTESLMEPIYGAGDYVHHIYNEINSYEELEKEETLKALLENTRNETIQRIQGFKGRVSDLIISRSKSIASSLDLSLYTNIETFLTTPDVICISYSTGNGWFEIIIHEDGYDLGYKTPQYSSFKVFSNAIQLLDTVNSIVSLIKE